MDKATPAKRWYLPWRDQPMEQLSEPDAADYGTAFGLDMSLADEAEGAPAVAESRLPLQAAALRGKP